MFKVGEKVVYPAHGVGEIEAIRSHVISGTERKFYMLRILETDMKIMIPIDNVESVGLRKVIDRAMVSKVYKVLRQKKVETDQQTWNRRYREYTEKIKTGSILEIAKVLRDLFVLKGDKELSFGERKMLDTARNLLVKELSIARSHSEEKIMEELRHIFTHWIFEPVSFIFYWSREPPLGSFIFSSTNMHVTAIIVAAGEGRRIGGPVSKSFLPIAGRPLVLRTLDRFFSTQSIEKVILVVADKELGPSQRLIASDPNLSHRSWVLQAGGASRQESVRRGLDRVDPDCEIVAIHDGARPFVSSSLIDRCIEEAYRVGAVVIGVPVRDTIKVVSEEHWVQATPARNTLWEIQTPQVFRKEIIVQAHDWGGRQAMEATDDSTLVEQIGKPVFLLEGERTNIKITVPEDLLLAEALLRDGRAC
jgi:2-C-methyl-D-erythritol 4-phosphate cytidylyltransferase